MMEIINLYFNFDWIEKQIEFVGEYEEISVLISWRFLFKD